MLVDIYNNNITNYNLICDVRRGGDHYITSYRTNKRSYEALHPYKYIFVVGLQPIYIFFNYLVSICTLSVAVPVLA